MGNPRTVTQREPGPPTLLWADLLLGERLYLSACVRFLVAATILLGGLFAQYVVGVRGLNIAGLAACSIVLVAYNTAAFLVVRRYRQPERAAGAWRRLAGLLHLTITLDFLVLTVLIWLVGGAESPFLCFYLLHVILAGMLSSRRAAYAHAALGYVLLAALVLGEGLEWWPKNRPWGAVPEGGRIGVRYVLTVLVAYGLLMALAAYLTTGLARMLREGERKLRQANDDTEGVSHMRLAFLKIALHDLRSPVAGISTLLTNLSSGLGGPLTAEQGHWVERAQTRARELLDFLRDLQVLGELETAQSTSQFQPVDVGALLRKGADEHRELAQRRHQSLSVEVPEDLDAVPGIERLLHEAVANYLTNAIKYGPEGGTIVVRALNARGNVRIEVRDQGRGIAPEDQARLFNDFVRILPKDRTGPPVSGTGLGLSIVRRIAETHNGRFGVVSRLEQGSTFYLELPGAKADQAEVKKDAVPREDAH